MDRVSQIARAVLYEGYILWPYRRSAPKNRQRWTFGGVFPQAWSARHPDDIALLQCQCLVEGPASAALSATVRCLHVVERRVADAQGRWVDELDVGGERHLAWEEATEREIEVAVGPGDAGPVAFGLAGGQAEEPLTGPDGRHAGAVVRRWEAIEGTVEAATQYLSPDLRRLTVRVSNDTPWQGSDRQQALRRALVSTHVALDVQGGAFVSLTDPPQALRAEAEACVNTGTWPVLVGEEGDRSQMLCAPIILEDHPQIAPESPGDLFDGGEIDQLLILNILSMTEEEQREMRDSDPKAREILERCTALGRDELMSLHGTIREFGPVEP